MSEDRSQSNSATRGNRKARARLALRAEKAFGLSSLPMKLRHEAANDEPSMSLPPDNPTPAARPVAGFSQTAPPTSRARSAESVSQKNKFDGSEVAKNKPLLTVITPTEPITVPEFVPDEKRIRLQSLDVDEVKGCTRCKLCETRTNTVFGEGDPNAKLMFVGEGPGENEDLQSRPFVGRAGQLLDKQIAAMGLRRDQVFIANVVKCRPPGNRTPTPDEAATCQPYLERQIEIVRPRVIVTLGLTSSQYLLQIKTTMGRMRGEWYFYRGIKVMPTFHPAYILRSYTREVREAVWSDLQKVMEELGLPKSPR